MTIKKSISNRWDVILESDQMAGFSIEKEVTYF